MGILNLFSKAPAETSVARLPSGSFTIDRGGQVVASTLPRAFDEALVLEIGKVVLRAFQKSQQLNLPLREIFIHYAGLKITARELRGGAMVFLTPVSSAQRPTG